MGDHNSAGLRPRLTRDRIVEVALDLARRDGLAGVSMRRIAGVLGVEAMSLYHYVPSKVALMVLMADRSVELMPVPDLTRPWDEQLVELTVANSRAAVQNPALFPVVSAEPLHPDALPTTTPESGATSLGLLERVLTLLTLGQIPDALQVHIFRGLIAMVVGFVVGQVDGLLPPLVLGDRAPSGRLGRPPPASLPLLTSMRPALTAADPVDGSRCSLELLLHSLTAHRAAASPS